MLPSRPTSSPTGLNRTSDAAAGSVFPMKEPPAVYLETKEVQPLATTPKFDTQKLPARSKVIPEGQLRPLSPGAINCVTDVRLGVNLSTPVLWLKCVAYTEPSGPTRTSCEAGVETENTRALVVVL